MALLIGAGAAALGAGGLYGFHRYKESQLYQHTHKEANMTGKMCIVTGAGSGMGYETSRELIARGATVIVTGRSVSKAEVTANALNSMGLPGKAVGMALELESLKSVRDFVEAYKAKNNELHVLVCNAGIMNTPYAVTQVGSCLFAGRTMTSMMARVCAVS